jgi:hypothetical protein
MRADPAGIAALRKEVVGLRAEGDLLKKGETLFRHRFKDNGRTLFSRARRHEVRLHGRAPAHSAGQRALRGAGGSRSGLHAWLNRPASTRGIHDATLVMAIETRFKASDRTHGARRVWRDVPEEGLACGLHRIERLMRIDAFRARPRRRGKPGDEGERSGIAGIGPVKAIGSSEPARPGPGLPGRPAEPEVAGRSRRHPGRRGPAACRGRSGPLLPPRSRLVREGRSRCVTAHGCPDDGGLAPRES